MIKPTVGRIVWYHKDKSQTEIVQYEDTPLAAIVCMVWSDRVVNLRVIDANGQAWPVTSVELIQEGETIPGGSRYCTWMPYQIGQAKKEEGK